MPELTPRNTQFAVISFEGPDLADKKVRIDADYVSRMLAEIVKNEDLSRYIL